MLKSATSEYRWRTRRPDTVSGAQCQRHAERFVRSIKEECLKRLILVGERRHRRASRNSSPIIIASGITKGWTTN
jgi:hypothetical protein